MPQVNKQYERAITGEAAAAITFSLKLGITYPAM